MLKSSELDRFLFAEVGVEASGNTLSVLSAFARIGLDPWLEGGRLAKLPRSAAVQVLTQIIASTSTDICPPQEATPIAVRLVSLLPGGSADQVNSAPAHNASVTLHVGHWVTMLAMLGTLLAVLTLNLVRQPDSTANGNIGNRATEGHATIIGSSAVVLPTQEAR